MRKDIDMIIIGIDGKSNEDERPKKSPADAEMEALTRVRLPVGRAIPTTVAPALYGCLRKEG